MYTRTYHSGTNTRLILFRDYLFSFSKQK